jgi:hypothetical protein
MEKYTELKVLFCGGNIEPQISSCWNFQTEDVKI